jgi:hypothetical protein
VGWRHQLVPTLPGIVGNLKFHSDAQFIQHLKDTAELNGRFAALEIPKKNMADTGTARCVVLPHTAGLSNGAHGHTDIMNTVNGNLHLGLTIETTASIIAIPQ